MTTLPSASRSRRDRPAKPALTKAGIVGTAVGIMRAEGLGRVTMRRLAQELDTGPASLYVYVRNTAALHAEILDELLGTVDLGPADTADTADPAADAAGEAVGDWRDRLVRILTSYTMVLFEHPGLAQSALVARPSGEHYLNLVEALLSLLSEGGVPPGRAAWALDLLLQFGTATAAEQTTRDQAIDAQDEQDALTTALWSASSQTYPHIAALGTDLLSGTGSDRLSWGFHVLINGTLHTPRPDIEASQERGHDQS
jgi:AcrR family transcriptional regulator